MKPLYNPTNHINFLKWILYGKSLGYGMIEAEIRARFQCWISLEE